MSRQKRHVLCLGLLLLFAGEGLRAQGFGPAANDTLPPEHLPASLHTYPNPNNFGKLEGGGRLVVQELEPAWLSTLTYFARGSAQGIMLGHNLAAINVFLTAEIRHPKTVQAFLKERLVLFLEDTMTNDGAIPITPGSEAGTGSDMGPQPSAAKRARLLAKIKRYQRPEEPTLAGKGWTLDVYMLTDHGALEHWLVKGSLKPLRIDSFLCEPKDPEGTFYPVPQFH